ANYEQSWNPGAGVITTARDLLRWNLALHNGKILSSKTYIQMVTSSISRNHPRYGLIGYGYGLQLINKDDFLEISHNGYLDGFTSTLIYYPKSKVSLIILENVTRTDDETRHVYSFHDNIREIVRKHMNL